MKQPSRIEAARRKVRIARTTITLLGTGVFAATTLVAQAMHPGHASAARAASAGQASLPSEPAAFANADASQSSVPLSPAPAGQSAAVQSSGS